MLHRRSFVSLAAASVLATPALAQNSRARTLRIAPQAGLASLDPIWTGAAVTQGHGYCVFDTLYALDAGFVARPQMAAGHRVSDDGLTWTVTLRDGLAFHDGTPVRAVDCVASLKRWAARDSFGQVLASRVDAWRVEDDATFSIRTKQPFPMMLYALGKPATSVPFIMPERLAATDPAKQITEMVGSGPYRFVADEFVAGSRAVYAKFDGYVPRREPAVRTSGGKVAHFERVEWTAMPDSSTALAALQAGEIDWWEQVLADTVPLLKRNPNVRITDGDPSGYIGILRFNSSQPPFDNVKLRAAILRAVNQADYMGAITDNDPGAYSLCHSFIPCGTPYGQPPANDRMSDTPDLKAVRTLIEASGYRGEKIVILNPTDYPTIRPMGQITHDTLVKLGLNADLVEVDWGTLVQRRANRESVEKGGWSIFHTWVQAVGSTAPPAINYIRGLGASGFAGWYGSRPVEDLTTRWLAATTEADRLSVAGELQRILADEAPVVPLGLFRIRTAHRSDIAGIVEGSGPFPWGVRRV